MSLVDYAKKELDAIGMTADSPDEMNRMMRDNVLQIIEVFAEQGHSGFSAPYCIGLVEKLMRYEPLVPLTGEDSEWMQISEDGIFQNKRCSSVFKDSATGTAYDIHGTVFRDQFGISYTSSMSRTPVKFPYTPTQKVVDVYDRDAENANKPSPQPIDT